MGYIGENGYFRFQDSFCEEFSGGSIGSEGMTSLGRTLSGIFGRISVSCSSYGRLHSLYALCSGIAECGSEVYMCENSDVLSFRFGIPLLSADCGVFICNSPSLKIMFFDRHGVPLADSVLKKIFLSSPAKPVRKAGKINCCTSFRDIYINNIADSLTGSGLSLQAGISCGDRSLRLLWLEFFSGEDDSLMLQIPDSCDRVNACSLKYGFIPYEKLVWTYIKMNRDRLEKVYLPDSFHFALKSPKIRRYSVSEGVPEGVVPERFLNDPLYMAVHLFSDRLNFERTVESIPTPVSVSREVAIDHFAENENRVINRRDSRVIIDRSGKNRVSVTVQAYSSETASELCDIWSDRIKYCSRE